MNAEALLGTVLGTSTLQQLIGQGGMGAVYLAQQSRPRRQVAVKVLMPATSLKPHQLSAFLERFRRETDAAASLEHPNIMPVYEYGERGGLAFLVMPYISGGTLRDVMEQEGQMSFADAVNYLEQMAAALDFAHARGVIHRDIKPANMLLTPDGRLLLTDFGLVKLLFDNQSEQMRLTGAGAPVGTPDYMSPEQVIGGDVDGRADQYSLGVVLFQMLTGSTPFQGETPMQIASQQLHMQPPKPRLLRSDLPEAAEMVILRAMSKRPDERFNSTQEFAFAFRTALVQPSAQPGVSSNRGGLLSNTSRSSLFDSKWQNTNSVPAFGTAQMNAASPLGAPANAFASETDTNTAIPRSTGAGLLSRTGMFPRIGENTGSFPVAEANPTAKPGLFSTGHVPTPGKAGLLGTSTGTQKAVYGQAGLPGIQQDASAQPTGLQSSLFAQSTQNFPLGNLQQLSPAQNTTNALSLLNPEQKSSNTVKLTGPVKVVQVPVAPGQYVTGLLPVQKDPSEQLPEPPAKKTSTLRKAVLLGLTLIVLIGAIGSGLIFLRSHNGATPAQQNNPTTGTKSDPTATFMSQATATAVANTVFFDPLNQNIHFFPVANSGPKQYKFENNAYHIINAGNEGVAVVVQQVFTQTTLGYQITMQEIKGDDTSPNNTFGMILRYSEATKNGKKVDTFYTFEILNEQGAAQYSFFKYDSSRTDVWGKPLWTAKPGKELHIGHGAKAINTIKVFADGSSFTFYVNGQKVGTHKDGSLTTGSMGMLVNLKGTEVAFSNMLITKKN